MRIVHEVRLPYLAVTLLCFLLTVAVKKWLRPLYGAEPFWGILGWSPSFLYCFGMALAVVAVRRFPWTYGIWLAVGATIYELLQSLIPRRTLDLADLIATVLGGVMALLLHHFLQSKETNHASHQPASPGRQ
ncbi:MAG: hypothetical protein OHK0029_42930 [Armatimonadaceae bacterium]